MSGHEGIEKGRRQRAVMLRPVGPVERTSRGPERKAPIGRRGAPRGSPNRGCSIRIPARDSADSLPRPLENAFFELPILIPNPRKNRGKASQGNLTFDEAKELSGRDQQYELISIINQVRSIVSAWRTMPSPADWHVTPETARLLQHWRHHEFSSIRPFFCQVKAVETAV
jgi:hypothetical protein